MAAKAKVITKMPTDKQLESMRQEDSNYVMAGQESMEYLSSRRQAIYNIARRYHLDVEELFQEGYEVLLTCMRDYTPVYEKKDGTFVCVQFNTFFGSRMDSRAMEMRNRDPEYQARQAFTDGMSSDEKTDFRKDPPLLVQHLDQESNMQEYLAGEASMAHDENQGDLRLRIMRDSFFDHKLNELIAAEKDEKKKAVLLHVKVGGIYNFQEIAYHFGVTDSRASQVMNELMDAFYVQRMISSNLASVLDDFDKLKFNEKRILRLTSEALQNAEDERAEELVGALTAAYDGIKGELETALKDRSKQKALPQTAARTKKKATKQVVYQEVFTDEENETYPMMGVEMRAVEDLQTLGMGFRPPENESDFMDFLEDFDPDSSDNPAVITEDGVILDGEKRIKAAQMKGRDSYLCIVRRVAKDQDKKLLRVMINMRNIKPTKIDLYFAICALADLGLSQQKIADWLDTSRTNVLVYAKVRDKASPRMRALFEDGLIQITNASSCSDMSDETQDRVADFIRRYGETWAKGSKFNDLHQSAVEGTLDALESKQEPVSRPVLEKTDTNTVSQLPTGMSGDAAQAMRGRLEQYEQTLKDAEVWQAQRESVIAQQTEQLTSAQHEIDTLRRELEASELKQFANPQAVETEIKEIRQFYSIAERLAGAVHAFNGAASDMRRFDPRRSHIRELTEMMDSAEQALNKFRLELLNKDKTNVSVSKNVMKK